MKAILKKDVRKLLTDLGPSVDAIAKKLRRLKVKGIPDNSCECPIAVYLRRKLPKNTGVDVHLTYTYVWNRQDDGAGKYVQIPKAVQKFIWEFDLGHIPGLDVRAKGLTASGL